MNNFLLAAMIALGQVLTATLLMIAANAEAESVSRNFRIRDTKRPQLTVAEIRKRFQVNSQVVVSDGAGKLVYFGNMGRASGFDEKGDLTVYEMSREPGIPDLALKMSWKLADDGSLSVFVQHYESMEQDPQGHGPKLGKLLREEKFEVKDFAPIDWLAFDKKGQRVTVRLTPSLADKEDDPIDVQAAALAFDNAVVFDSKGFFWARTDGGLEGRYLMMRTHMGQFAISFVPFKGAKEIGYAQGSQITLNAPGMRIFLRSGSPVVTGSRPAKIYGMIDLEKRMPKVNAVQVQSGDKEKEFLRDL